MNLSPSRSACTRHREDLALLAGHDLPPGPEHDAALAHAATCGACGALLEQLAGDRDAMSRAARLPDPAAASDSLVAAVLARAAAEAMAEGVFRPAVVARKRDFGLATFGRMAAAFALVAASAILGFSLLSHDAGVTPTADAGGHAGQALPQAPEAGATGAPVASAASNDAPAPALPIATRPVRVRRAAGDAVAVEWDGDGRENERTGRAYKVLASASPRDFSEARPVLVAGRSLIASERMPADHRGDRSLTYFRVE